ncbi:MAG TPA: hypothetical protein ENN43_04890 [bacterium]|nr:hypothetical protein [bacterium]
MKKTSVILAAVLTAFLASSCVYVVKPDAKYTETYEYKHRYEDFGYAPLAGPVYNYSYSYNYTTAPAPEPAPVAVSNTTIIVLNVVNNTHIFYRGGKEIARWVFERNGAIKKTGASLSGKVHKFYPSGKIKAEFYYSNNSRQGAAKFLYETGEVLETVSYYNGMRHGNYNRFYPNGRPMERGVYRNNEIYGTITRYFDDGAEAVRLQIKDGKEVIVHKSPRFEKEEMASKTAPVAAATPQVLIKVIEMGPEHRPGSVRPAGYGTTGAASKATPVYTPDTRGFRPGEERPAETPRTVPAGQKKSMEQDKPGLGLGGGLGVDRDKQAEMKEEQKGAEEKVLPSQAAKGTPAVKQTAAQKKAAAAKAAKDAKAKQAKKGTDEEDGEDGEEEENEDEKKAASPKPALGTGNEKGKSTDAKNNKNKR